MATGYESSIRHQELADLRQKLAAKRRRLTELESELLLNSGEQEAGGRIPEEIRAEIAPLKAEIDGLSGRHRELANFLEGEPEEFRETSFEKVVDFLKSYWIVFALVGSMGFLAFSGEITAYFGKNTDEEAAKLRENFSGAGQAQLGELVEHFEEQADMFENRYGLSADDADTMTLGEAMDLINVDAALDE